MKEDAAVLEQVRALVLPLDRLCPAQAAEAIRTAGELGRVLGDEFRACVLCLLRDRSPITANSRAYSVYLIEPWWRECGLEEAERRGWDEAFSGGAALRDPRVQAFCAGLAEQAWRIAGEVDQQRTVLARYIETDPGRIAFSGSAPRAEMIFGFRDDRYLVLSVQEVEGECQAFGEGSGSPTRSPFAERLPRVAGIPPRITVDRFLDRWIVHWRETRADSEAGPRSRCTEG